MKIKLVFILINGLNLYGNKILFYFDKKYFILSKRFAPGGWTQSTKDDNIIVNKRYLPFWNLSLQGSINASINLAQTQTNRVRFFCFYFIIKYFFSNRIKEILFQFNNGILLQLS